MAKIEGIMEIGGKILVYGQDCIEFFELVNANSKDALLKRTNVQKVNQDNSVLNILVYYQPQNGFFGGHASGNLSLWNPSPEGLNLINIAPVHQGVKLLYLEY